MHRLLVKCADGPLAGRKYSMRWAPDDHTGQHPDLLGMDGMHPTARYEQGARLGLPDDYDSLEFHAPEDLSAATQAVVSEFPWPAHEFLDYYEFTYINGG
jgi:hypothetical protein